MSLNHEWITLQGIRIHYFQAGVSGAPVILLHGGGTDSASLSWGHLIGPLSAHHQIFALDWPGYGASDRPVIEHSISLYVSVLADFIQALSIGQPSLMGISMGGAAALGYTLTYPEGVNKLVLVDSYGLQDRFASHALSYLFVHLPLINEFSWSLVARNPSMRRASLAAIFSRPEHISDELMALVTEEVQRPGAGAAFRSFQKNEMTWRGMRTVYMDRLPEIRVPTLILHGAQDQLVPPRFAQEAHQKIEGSQLVMLENAGHWPQREQPEEFLKVVEKFLG